MKTTRRMQLATERRGFTLIELMVVVAIAGMLASLILPALSRAKETAWSTVCKNSLRQRALGIQFHVNDFGKYPVSLSEAREQLGPSSSSDFCPTVERDARRIYTCCGPMSPFGSEYLYNAGGTGSLYWSLSGDFDTKVYLGLGGSVRKAEAGGKITSGLPESSVVAPASMIALTHMASRQMLRSVPLGFGGPGYYEHPSAKGGPLHKRGENAVFCDGHVESEDSTHIPLATNSYGWVVFKPDTAHARRWNHDNQPHPETWLED